MPLIALDIGLSRPISSKSYADIITQADVLSLSVDGRSSVSTIFADNAILKLPDGVVYSYRLQRLFITNMGSLSRNDGSVISMRPDGSDPLVILSPGQVHTPKQLALDAENDKLYICDREGMRVLRCGLDGFGLETLVRTGDVQDPAEATDQTKWCVGIAVSPMRGVFYWTQKGPSKGGRGRIFCSPMTTRCNDGQSAREQQPVCLLDQLPEPIDLNLDEDAGILYWTDRGELPYGNTLNRVRLDETGTRLFDGRADSTTGLRYEIIVQNFDEAIGLAFDPEERRWFVSDMGGTIWSFDADGGNRTVVFHHKERAFTGIELIKD